MPLVLLIAILACCAAALFLPIWSFWDTKRDKRSEGEEVYQAWWNEEVRRATARATVTIVIWTIFAIIGLTIFLYLFDTGVRFDAVLNYLSFAGPTLAALVVGAGILKLKPDVQQPLTEIDFRYYFLGLPLLVLGYLGFIGKTQSHLVNIGASIMGILAFAVPLLALILGHYPRAVPVDRRSYAGIAFLVLGIALLVWLWQLS
jgi:hypothetical protein